MDFRKIAYVLIGLTALLVIVTVLLFMLKTTSIDYSLPIDTHLFGDFGAFVGGISAAALTIASIFLIIQTLNDQQNNFRVEQNQLRINFEKDQLESRFFELLKIHRENSNDIAINEKFGKKVFLSLLREFYQCFELVTLVDTMRTKKLPERDIINIAYLCFFFGAVGDNSARTIKANIKKYTDPNHLDFIDNLLNLFNQQQSKIKEIEKFNYTPFEGHQSRLSHYFRHLFQTVKFIDGQQSEVLSYREKYDYIKTVRAQLSTQEQALLFFNSLSDLGSAWEEKAGDDENKKLITKYNLIKNIPTGYTHKVNIRSYYKNIHFEGDENITEQRKELESKYT